MTPQDMPGPLVTIEALFPWLAAITPAQEPRPIRPRRRSPRHCAKPRDRGRPRPRRGRARPRAARRPQRPARDDRRRAPAAADRRRCSGFELVEVDEGRVVFAVDARRAALQPDRHGPRRPGRDADRLGHRLRRPHDAAGRHRLHDDRRPGALRAPDHARHGADRVRRRGRAPRAHAWPRPRPASPPATGCSPTAPPACSSCHRTLEQGREHDLRLRPDDPRRVADALERLLEVRRCRARARAGSRSPRPRPCRRRRPRGGRRPPRAPRRRPSAPRRRATTNACVRQPIAPGSTTAA